MANTKVKKAPSFDKELAGKVKEIIKNHVETYFSSSLGSEGDIVNIFAALIYYESRYGVSAVGVPVSSRPGTGGGQYMASSSIKRILDLPSNSLENLEKKNNVLQGLTALGLTQVMGWNLIKGAAPSGRSEIRRLRPDLADLLEFEPGTDLKAEYLGEDNISKQILAGLIILEGKYRATVADGDYFYVRGDSYKRAFESRIAGAVAAYLGLGKADANKTTPEQYSASIVGGDTYKIANGPGVSNLYGVVKKTSTQVAQGPVTNSRYRTKVTVPGCA